MSRDATRHRYLPAGLTVSTCLLLWLAYDHIGQLRGTFLWELRYIALGCAAFLLLTLAERLIAWLARLGKAKETDEGRPDS